MADVKEAVKRFLEVPHGSGDGFGDGFGFGDGDGIRAVPGANGKHES